MKVFIGVGIVFILVGLLGVIASSLDLPPDTYIGKEVFQTEESYVQFKESVGRTGVEINKLETLASNPPIIVSFSVDVEKGIDFPYGHIPSSGEAGLSGLFISAMLLIGIGSVILLVVAQPIHLD